MLNVIKDNYINKSDFSNRRRRASPNTSSFASALRDPFDPKAIGCRIPDEYSYPTATYHHLSSVTLTTSASGNCSVLFLPAPLLSMVRGTGTVTATQMVPFSSSASAYRAVNPAALSNNLENFRVVSWGIRIRNLQAPGTATGMIEVAQTPALGHIPGYKTLEYQNVTFDYLVPLITGTVTSSGDLASLLAYPESDEYAVQELMANDLLFVGKVCSSEWTTFRNPDTSNALAATLDNVDAGNVTTATGLVTQSSPSDPTQSQGRTAVCIRLRGFPASINVLDVEYIAHYEGTPSLNFQPSISAGSAIISVSNPTEVRDEITKLSRSPVGRIIPPWILHARGALAQGAHGALDVINSRLGLGAASGSIPRRVAAVGVDAAVKIILKKLMMAKAARKVARKSLGR